VDNSLLRFARFGMSERLISLYYFTWFTDRFVGLKTIIPININTNNNNQINSIIEFTSTYVNPDVDNTNYEKIKEIKLDQTPLTETILAQNIDFKGFTDNLYLLIDITKFLRDNGYLDYFNETLPQNINDEINDETNINNISINRKLFLQYYNSLVLLIKQKLENLFSKYFDFINLFLILDISKHKFIACQLLVRIKPTIIINSYNDNNDNIVIEINNMVKDKIGDGNIRMKFFTSKFGKDYFDVIGYRQVIKVVSGQLIAEMKNQNKGKIQPKAGRYETIKEKKIVLKYTIE